MIIYSIGVLALGIIGSFLLAKSIRKDTLGLEPHEISSLYREKEGILQSVKEGIMAIDAKRKVTMTNFSAKSLLDITQDVSGKEISEVIHSPKLLEVLHSNKPETNIEILHNQRTLIINTQPIFEEEQTVGVVASFRDKTDIKKKWWMLFLK
ncbi:PAS domain-containing protein [Radiobacillus deserti]|uniref:PAS domain-containing protein n=1 Tax=Radiobacillus deserti TaxID=2594883 RepID=UPI001E4A21D7|nr:PAS domain-containing protein [Radiobacillus deserti]